MLILSDAMTDLDIQELANLTAGDADVDNFERLFTKLKEMKGICQMGKNAHCQKKLMEMWRSNVFFILLIFKPVDKASSLPHEQRKVHAEKVSATIHTKTPAWARLSQ